MDKYIKLEPLLKELEENTPYNWSNEDYEQGEVNGYKYAVSIVEAQDIADVAEVRHGKWIGKYHTTEYNDWMCSCCGMYETETRNRNRLGNYCRWCGAKMDS